MVLPSTTGMGVCSTSLTFFLVNANNECLGAYRSATNQDRYIIFIMNSLRVAIFLLPSIEANS